MKSTNDTAIYKDYLKTRGDKATLTVKDVAEKHGISRTHVYQVVERVENGEETALGVCLEKGLLACLWKHKFSKRFSVIKDDKVAFAQLVKDMAKDGYSGRKIAEFTKRDRLIIIRILKK